MTNPWQPGLTGSGPGGSSASAAAPVVRTVAVDTLLVSGLADTVTHRFQVRAVNADGTAGTASDTVWVVPLRAQAGDGRVKLSWDNPSAPGVSGWQYRQQAGVAAWQDWQAVSGSGAATSTHTVTGLTNGVSYRFQVRGRSATKTRVASFTAAARPVGVPSAPVLTAQAGDKQVALSWTAADSNGAWVTSYSVRDSSAGSWSAWTSVPGQGTARDTTRTGLTNGRAYTFEVRARNRVGEGDSSRVSATPQQVAVSGADSVWYAENRTYTVASYRVSPSGGSWAWSLAGADSSLFSIASSGRVSFASPPDFERPSDADSNNVHALTVRATPSSRGLSPLSRTVAVTVTNVNEAGAISLTPPRPKVNQPITARLSDPDTVASVTRWRWMPYIEGGGGIGFGGTSQAEAEAAAVETAGSLSSTYTPSFLFRNFPLEVTVFYADRLGSGRQARRVTAAVGAPNRAPTLSGVSDTTFAENDTAAVAA